MNHKLNHIIKSSLKNVLNEQNNIKGTTKVSESQLRRVIREAIKESLGDTAETFMPFTDVNDRANHSGLRTKKQQMDSDWHDIDIAYPFGGKYSRQLEDDLANTALENGEYPYGREFYRDMDMNDMWNDYEGNWDVWDYENIADSRPLHRKGSLNRELDESIRRAIRKYLH